MSIKIEEMIKTNFNKRLYDDVIADLALLFYVYNRHKKVLGILHGFRKRLPYRNIYIMSDDENAENDGRCKSCGEKCDFNAHFCSICQSIADDTSEY